MSYEMGFFKDLDKIEGTYLFGHEEFTYYLINLLVPIYICFYVFQKSI